MCFVYRYVVGLLKCFLRGFFCDVFCGRRFWGVVCNDVSSFGWEMYENLDVICVVYYSC